DEEKMDNNPLVRLMKKYLEKLTQEQRICIELFYFHGLDYKKIVFKTGFSFSLVKSAIQNGKRKLRLLLENTPGFNYEQVRIVFR
ncbi:MAG: hypothetical protein MI922_14405, partial [Bacteroidales bacterium]|nr:hypothetical protein [Bacteroidales bacterium]